MNTLEVKHVSKSYGSYQALSDVSIQVPEQTVFGLLGPNGAGKTSLIRIINQITGPDKGEVFFNGEPLKREHIEQIGYLPEERGLYKKMKVGEQCMYLAQLKGLSSHNAKAVLKDWFKRFEIEHWWDKKIEELSKGMAQKVQFITTVLHEPKLLILDEPFSGFDPINAELIRTEMLRLKDNGATIILSTHDMGSVETLCDNIALINRSHLILSGGVKEVKNRFRTKIYEVVYTGTAMDLAISLWSNFELIKNEKVDDHMVAHIRLLRDHTLNDLLGVLLKDLQIESVRELIPDMDAIFIQAVNSFNNNNNG
ncbi:MAG: ABC transporter ATP-binding protein [Flavobacteriales bacterium]|jgi:ABC-2 type transport system ATP-binding protein